MGLPHILLLFGSLGTAEILFILLLLLLLFGAQKIPDLARSLGKAQREFTRAREELEAAPSTAATAASSEDERIRKAARDLGISTEGKSTDDLKAELSQRLK